MTLANVESAQAQHMLGGKGARDFFPDPQLAALAIAAEHGDEARIVELVRAGVPIDGLAVQNQLTPLSWALTARSFAGARKLLELGADPNQRLILVKTPFPLVLIYAESNQPDFLELLLKFKADPNVRANELTASPLMKAVMIKRNVELLLQYGADVNYHQPQFLRSAGVVAANLGQLEVLELLLSKGLNVTLDVIAFTLQDRPFAPELVPHRNRILHLLEERGIDLAAALQRPWLRPPK